MDTQNTKNLKVLGLIQQMQKLDSVIPANEGSIGITFYADLSWKMEVEISGKIIATRIGEFNSFIIDYSLLSTEFPKWEYEFVQLIGKINEKLKEFD